MVAISVAQLVFVATGEIKNCYYVCDYKVYQLNILLLYHLLAGVNFLVLVPFSLYFQITTGVPVPAVNGITYRITHREGCRSVIALKHVSSVLVALLQLCLHVGATVYNSWYVQPFASVTWNK
jgi:hypothetical protein